MKKKNRFRRALMHTSFDNLVVLYVNEMISRKEARQQIKDRKRWIIELDRQRDREADAYEALEAAAQNILIECRGGDGRPTVTGVERLQETLKVLSDMRELNED